MQRLVIPLEYYALPPIRAIKYQDFDAVMLEHRAYGALTERDRALLVRELEHGCLHRATRVAEKSGIKIDFDDAMFMSIYCDVCYEALYKLSKAQGQFSERLAERIFAGTFAPHDLGAMTGEMYIPELYQKHKEKYDIVSNVSENIKTSELYTCHRCGRNQCIVEKNPCRSADEQIPLRITCVFCNNKWSG